MCWCGRCCGGLCCGFVLGLFLFVSRLVALLPVWWLSAGPGWVRVTVGWTSGFLCFVGCRNATLWVTFV